MQAESTTPRARPEHRGVSRRTVIKVAKEAIPTIDLADLLTGPCGLRRIGSEWVGRCPLPDHEDKTPSFSVNTENNLWICYGCNRGGDVIELARFAWGYSKQEAPMAAANLLHEFGIEIPQKPASWHAKQERQRPVRNALEEAKVRRVQRRLYRWLFAPIVATFEDDTERAEEARTAWADCEKIARLMVRKVRSKAVA